jgi:hypothetical protein
MLNLVTLIEQDQAIDNGTGRRDLRCLRRVRLSPQVTSARR